LPALNPPTQQRQARPLSLLFLFGRFVVPRFVFLAQNRGTDLFYATLGADNADQIAAAELQLVRLADRVQLFEMLAGHSNTVGWWVGEKSLEADQDGCLARPAPAAARLSSQPSMSVD
jgi:hypothetical protein